VHILHIAPYYAPAWAFGGVVSALAGLAPALVERGHQVTVLTTDALDFTSRLTGAESRQEVLAGVEIIRCPNVSHTVQAKFNLSTPRGMRRAFHRLRPDVIHTHELRTVPNLLLLPRPSRVPVILSPHGTLTYDAGRSLIKRIWDQLFGARIMRRITSVAALTQAEMQDSQVLWTSRGLPFPDGQIIPNGIAADFAEQVAKAGNLRERFGLGNGPVVLFFGRLHERKGLQFLIPAFAQAARNDPTARLLVVGPDAGMLDAAREMVEGLGIGSNVTFTGMLSGADRLAALHTGDVFVLPAIGEGLSMAALEAMAAGLPLLLTPGCNLPEVEPRGAGRVVAREIAPLAAALASLLDDPDQRQTMGQNGKAWAQSSFIWPVIAAQMERFYQTAQADLA